jgi:hypothetical protein
MQQKVASKKSLAIVIPVISTIAAANERHMDRMLYAGSTPGAFLQPLRRRTSRP